MPRKKSKTRMYFTEETEQAIIDYNSTDDWRTKNQIYNASRRKHYSHI